MNKKKIIKEIEENRKKATALFYPTIMYDYEYDILNIKWLNNEEYDSSIETDNDFIFDMSKKGQIIGIEVHSFLERINQKKLNSKNITNAN